MSTPLTMGNGPGKDHPVEKFLRWLPLIGIGVAVFWFWGIIVPFVKQTLEDTLKASIYAGVLGFLILFLRHKWAWVKMTYKSVFHWIASLGIKMDPLSYMDRYVDILMEKLGNVRKAIVNLKAAKVNLERKMQEDVETYENKMKLAQAAMQQGNRTRAEGYSLDAKGAKDSVELYKPTLTRIVRSLEFLEPLAENWEVSIESMKGLIDRKRRDFKTLKENAKALNQAEEFLRGDTEEGRIYQESMKALEEQISQKIAYIEDFESRAKPIMEGAAIEKQMRSNEGMAMLEEYMKVDKLLMPNFSASMYTNKLQAETISYTDTKSNSDQSRFEI